MSNNKTLPFSVQEYRARLEKLQTIMKPLGLDTLVVSGSENLYYLSGISLNYGVAQFLIVNQTGDPQLLVYVTEEYNAKRLNWVDDWVSYRPDQDPFSVIREMLAAKGQTSGTIGIQKNVMSAEDFESLSTILAGADIIDSSGMVETLRMIKSPAEIDYMRAAARAVEEATRSGINAIAEGKTEAEIAAVVYETSILAGSEHMYNTNFIVSGKRSVIPHGTWSGKKITNGDIVFFENSCRVNGYTVPLLRTAILGKPSKEIGRAAETVVTALNQTIAAMHPGVTSGKVQRACESVFEEAGYRNNFLHRAGYTIGLQWPETYAMSIQPDDTRQLQPGMVFHLVPHLEFHQEQYGVACGEVILITETGCEALTQFDRKLFVI